MSDKKGCSRKNFFGGYTHYDGDGNKIGESRKGFFGTYTNYDADGNEIGHTKSGFFGAQKHYDKDGREIGRSEPRLGGGLDHYDKDGRQTGSSRQTFGGGYRHTASEEGCFIATCVYGGYDAPQVMTLRRFRDRTLLRTVPGRAFVRIYYAVSPTFVRIFGGSAAVRRIWKCGLDGIVRKLEKEDLGNER